MTPAIADTATGALRLLLVEDDLRSASSLRKLLEGSDTPNFTIRHVTTAAAACTAVEDGGIDVVILDLGLPDAHDLEALNRLQECVHEIPVIVLTGQGDETLAAEALHGGAEDYLLKGSIGYDALLRSIRYAVERHRGVRDLARMKKELESANRHLERLTLIEPLTELLNRRGLQQALSREVQHLGRTNNASAALVVDLDDFKQINDQHGHSVGDVVLKEIGRRLRASVRAVDYVGRLGGDEFMLILPETESAEVTRVAERIRLAIATAIIQHASGTVTLTASIAAMLLTTEMPAVDQLLARAHLLLSRAKNEGKNQVVFQSVDFDDTARRQRAQADMCANLTRGKHVLTVKQPIFRLDDDSPIGYEFLSRYSNGTFEMPENFFRLCAEKNVLTLVDHACLRAAIQAAEQLPPYVRFHLNIFPTTLLAIPVEHLLDLFPNPIPADTFCLEISEQQIIGHPTYLVPAVQALREAGILIAIDDVGFGSSCLESLVLLEPDILKIDKRCVIGIDTDPPRVEHLRRYIRIARTLGCQVVAEGIETQEELAILRSLGIEYGQGYLWGKPA
ncbi:MAG TPA: EAL domain-containing protein [Thermoanaerobaculia bacterium]|nr:EAL domain-containing protein [Thermoanaerobaculia bacterium]